MNLEDLRREMDTEARQRCQAQEKTIKDLHAKIKEQEGWLAEYQGNIRVLQNRCWALTRGCICLFCGMRKSCAAKQGKGENDG